MPRSQEANQEIRAIRESQIREAAATQFAHKGYVGTRIEDITEATGISKGLIYHYFGSKEALFTVLIERAAKGTLGLYEAAGARSGTAVERLRWLIENIIEGLAEQPDMFMVVMHALVSEAVPDEAHACARTLAQGAMQVLTHIIFEGQEVGDIKDGPAEQLALLVNSCIQGLAVGRIMEAPVSSVADVLISLIAK